MRRGPGLSMTAAYAQERGHRTMADEVPEAPKVRLEKGADAGPGGGPVDDAVADATPQGWANPFAAPSGTASSASRICCAEKLEQPISRTLPAFTNSSSVARVSAMGVSGSG